MYAVIPNCVLDILSAPDGPSLFSVFTNKPYATLCRISASAQNLNEAQSLHAEAKRLSHSIAEAITSRLRLQGYVPAGSSGFDLVGFYPTESTTPNWRTK